MIKEMPDRGYWEVVMMPAWREASLSGELFLSESRRAADVRTWAEEGWSNVEFPGTID